MAVALQQDLLSRVNNIHWNSAVYVLGISAIVTPEDGFIAHAEVSVTMNDKVMSQDLDVQGFPNTGILYILNDKEQIRIDLGLSEFAPTPPTLTFVVTIVCEIATAFKNNNFAYNVGLNKFKRTSVEELFFQELNMNTDPAFPIGVNQSLFRLTVDVDLGQSPSVSRVFWG
jgi:hypothetical protein